MTAKNQNFEMYAGDTKTVTVTVSGVDLTGASVKWAAKKSIYNVEPDIYKETADGLMIAASDSFVIALAPEDTAALVGSYYHEAEVTDAAGNVSTVMTGTVKIERSGV